MRRSPLAFVALFTLFASACRDTVAPEVSRSTQRAAAEVSCTADGSELLGLAAEVFGAGSPNFNSVRGKIENLIFHQSRNNTEQAKFRAHDIVGFTLTKNSESQLPGQGSLTEFTNTVYCYAGIDLQVEDPANTALIFPTDAPQIIYNGPKTVGISFPGNPVIDPSLIVIEKKTSSQLGGLTKLDRYPGFIEIKQLNESGTKLAEGTIVTITVCAQVPFVEDLGYDPIPDLRLAHGFRFGTAEEKFVITPRPADTPGAPETPTPDCDLNEPTLRLSQRIIQAATSLFTPKPLYARSTMLLRGGGISGTASEFSPFEPVDTKLRAGGGISGTASEFTRMPAPMVFADGVEAAACVFGSYPLTVPQGAQLPGSCLPMTTVTTRQGTTLENVPVSWTFTKPAGSLGGIARASGNASAFSCQDAYANTASGSTNADGNAAACVKLDSAGVYEATASLSIGGEAPEGVTFFTSDSEVEENEVSFGITVAPVTISITSPNPVTAAPGATLAPQVRVMLNGNPAPQVMINWTALANSQASVSPASSLTDSQGYASTGWTIGNGYNELRAKVANTEDNAVTFTATGSGGLVTLNSCPVGGSRDPINDPSRPFVFYVPGPGNNQVIREIDLYFGASGKANRPSDYEIELEVRRGQGFNGPVLERIPVTVELRGSASENKLATFRLATPISGSLGGGGTNGPNNAIAMRLVVKSNPDNATVNFNTGPCPLGNCKVPSGCNATEVNANTVTSSKPLGDVYRRSLGISVRGN